MTKFELLSANLVTSLFDIVAESSDAIAELGKLSNEPAVVCKAMEAQENIGKKLKDIRTMLEQQTDDLIRSLIGRSIPELNQDESSDYDKRAMNKLNQWFEQKGDKDGEKS